MGKQYDTICPECGGLRAKPGVPYGWGGTFCQCPPEQDCSCHCHNYEKFTKFGCIHCTPVEEAKYKPCLIDKTCEIDVKLSRKLNKIIHMKEHCQPEPKCDAICTEHGREGCFHRFEPTNQEECNWNGLVHTKYVDPDLDTNEWVIEQLKKEKLLKSYKVTDGNLIEAQAVSKQQLREELIEKATKIKRYKNGKPTQNEYYDCECGYSYDDCECEFNRGVDSIIDLIKSKKE